MSDDAFRRGLAVVLGHEGGYADDPDDAGGATNFGVTTATYDAFRRARGLPIRPVRQIEPSEVEAIYRGYWDDAGCERLPPALGIAHFDCAINCGPGSAIRILQRAVGTVADGILGPRTIEAVRSHPDVLDDYLWARADYYLDIVVRRPVQAKFLASWIRRLQHLRGLLRY